MSEFVFNRATFVAMAVVTVLLGVLTFTAGVLSGVLWVEQLAAAERLALLGAGAARDAEPAVVSAASPVVSTATEPAASTRPRRPDVLPATDGARAVSPVGYGGETWDLPRRTRWVKISRLEWRRIDEPWSADLDSIDLHFDNTQAVPATPYGELIYQTSRRHSMNPLLVAAMVKVESDFDPNAVSPRGARGLMQVLPATASRFGVEGAALYEPAQNLEAGVRYLRWLSRRFAGDPRLTLSAYNAGEKAVERYGGTPPYDETRRYLEQIYTRLGLAGQDHRTAR